MDITSNSPDKSTESSEITKEEFFQANIKKINNNYPLLNVSRLEKGDININISFDNLKLVNENYSKEEADIGINIVKELFNNFFENNEDWKANRTVKETYKSKLFWLKEENLYDMIKVLKEEIPTNINIENKESKIIVFNSLIKETYSEEEIRKKAKEKINIFFENNDKYIEKNNLKKENIEEIIDILWVNISVKENKAETFKEKLLHIYEIEFDSYINSSVLKEALSDDEDLLDNLKNKNKKLLEKSELIAKKVRKIEKEIEQINSELSYSKNPENFFNSLEIVKKWNSTWNKKLDKLFLKYKTVISAFDIITPITEEIDYEKLEEKTQNQDEVIKDYKKNISKEENFSNNKKLEIYSDVEDLTRNTYKKGLTRDFLAQEIIWKKGTLFFVDIAWMWINNIKENRRKIVESFLKKNISEEEKEKKLLEAWLEMTKKVTKIIEELTTIWAKVSREWDEIFIFIPEVQEKNIKKEKIIEIFTENQTQARSTYIKIAPEKELKKEEVFSYFDKLDHISNINKKVENAWKFYISEKEEENKWYLKNTKENYKIEVKNILKENTYLKEKQKKIINFFEVNKEDLIFSKEKIIENFKWKINSTLEKWHIEILNNKKRKILKENLTKAWQIKFEILVSVLDRNKKILFSFIDILWKNWIINFSKFINNLEKNWSLNPNYSLFKFFEKINNSWKQKFVEILENFDDNKIENFTNFFNRFWDNWDDLAEFFNDLENIEEFFKIIWKNNNNNKNYTNTIMNQINWFNKNKYATKNSKN